MKGLLGGIGIISTEITNVSKNQIKNISNIAKMTQSEDEEVMVQQCNPIKRILQDKNYSLFLTNGNEKDFFFVTKKHSNSSKKKNNTKNEVLRVQESTL